MAALPRAAGLAMAVCALLAGCASMAPPHERPPLPVPARYAEADGASGTAAPAWQQAFADPTLQALMGQALANSRDLRSAVLRVAEARAVYGIQRADAWPTLVAQAVGERSRVPADLSITRRPLLASDFQVGLGVASWELDFWGRVRSLKDAALDNYLATEAAQRAATLALVTDVAQGYLAWRELDERLALARRAVASRQDSLRIFTRRESVGATSRLNVTQVQALLTQAQALAAQLAQAREQQGHALALLVGSPVDLQPGDVPLAALDLLPELQPGLPSDLLQRRPDIVAAEYQLKAAHANIGAARAAFFPRIALTGSFGSASTDLNGLFDAGSRAWTFSPTITLPLFDGGRNRANLDLAETRRELAVARYERAVQAAFRDVSDALSARHWIAEQLAVAQTALAAQTERARLSQRRFDSGAAGYLDVLDAERDRLAAEQQLVQTRRALLASRVSLYSALGGATTDHPSTSGSLP
jgi:multidrug efflux system outer membrane protein